MRKSARLQDEAWSSLEAPPDGDALQLARLLTAPALACTASLAAALRALGQQVSACNCALAGCIDIRLSNPFDKLRVQCDLSKIATPES